MNKPNDIHPAMLAQISMMMRRKAWRARSRVEKYIAGLNTEREQTRRRRQMAAGQLKFQPDKRGV